MREIRCDLFSVDSLARALHVGKPEVLFWIKQGWLEATINAREEGHPTRSLPKRSHIFTSTIWPIC